VLNQFTICSPARIPLAAVVVAVGKTPIDHKILTLDVTEFTHALPERPVQNVRVDKFRTPR